MAKTTNQITICRLVRHTNQA